MQLRLSMAIILPVFILSGRAKSVGQIIIPDGYARIPAAESGFATYIRSIALKPESTVYLFNGQPKPNQAAQFAVLDLPIEKNHLIQCADAVIMIRANWLLERQLYEQIRFLATDGTWLSYTEWCEGKRFRLSAHKLMPLTNRAPVTAMNSRTNLRQFLQLVYTYCGTASLSRQMKKQTDLSKLKVGDVFLQGGHPGHVMMVADLIRNQQGEQAFMLLQGFMPAQDIHIVKAVCNALPQPWYLYKGGSLATPEWTFDAGAVYTW